MCLTKNFRNYLSNYNPSLEKDRLRINELEPETNAAFDGEKVFDIFFKGTNYRNYPQYNGPAKFVGLEPRNFGHW